MNRNVASAVTKLLEILGLFTIHIDKIEAVEGRRHLQRERWATLDLLLGLLEQMYACATEPVDIEFFFNFGCRAKAFV